MQAPFLGKSPKNTGKDSTNRQVGTSSAGSPNRGAADTSPKFTPSTKAFYRPNIAGKVDNRNIVGGKK